MAGQLITVPAIVQAFKPMADRSWRITFETQELNGEQLSVLADHFQGQGWLLFSPNELALADIPEETADAGVKSPSQRLRSKIYILWKQKGGRGDFESYYRTSLKKLEEIIDSQLEPR